ncbi:dipeptidase [Aquiflexum gelatinilyticum]|uniref:Membrane dipeptidase n=1 Tax=Aquiflexum gelatinilyticum TaxID=2961943 RepID=A0A9X2P4N5_9BACT|nr:membrane dipeptidase [Aquiflexum gelatinilyticum]MCR9013422.1 membrane dipeptidase [Aquiflexum gelatinilyticum]MCS4436463.1 membrane dipeptidase [Aquiflexum gelatinilyticum]
MKKTLIAFIGLFLIYWIATMVVPGIIEKKGNPVKTLPPYKVSPEAQALFNSFDFVADLHCDALLWGRDLTKKSENGHVDFPRMQEGNAAMQVFTIVSKSPKGQNMEVNSEDATDNITLLNIAQGRPVSNWFSLMKRTLYQSALLEEFSRDFDGQFMIIKSSEDVKKLAEARKTDKNIIGGLLGIEGGHALEGKIENLDKAYEAGVRLIGPSHFFDNELGGSAHGLSGEGLTDFGKAVVKRMNELNMVIDLAHASPKMFDDVLELSSKPVMVSHTGIRAVLNSPRNLSDGQIRRLAAKGGIIGIAFFDMAVGENEISGIVACMKRVKNLVGIQHIALGSDYDGNVAVPFDITGLPIIVEAMMQEGFSDEEIKAIMGENVKRFLLENL